MLKLTQCLIVKNEEKNLSKALEWGKDLADEQIVVDTGSEDNTVLIAQELGAKVLHFNWTDNFSEARNYAISQCSGDWILFLDADEYFEEREVPLIRPLIEKVDSQSVFVRGKEYRYNIIETPWVNVHNNSVTKQARIFKNVPYLRYSGALHEQLHAAEGGYRQIYTVKDSPAIYHTGYAWSTDNKMQEKGKRNYDIAKKALEESPDSAKFQLFAAEGLLFEEKYEEAEEYFSKALKNSDGSLWPERIKEGYKQWMKMYLRRKDFEREKARLFSNAEKIYSEAILQFPQDPDYDMIMSLLCFRTADPMNTLDYLKKSLEKNDGKLSESIVDANSESYKKLSAICEKLKAAKML